MTRLDWVLQCCVSRSKSSFRYKSACKRISTPASLISHALNEILALGIPRYTYGQLVATAFFCVVGKEIQKKKQDTKLSVH